MSNNIVKILIIILIAIGIITLSLFVNNVNNKNNIGKVQDKEENEIPDNKVVSQKFEYFINYPGQNLTIYKQEVDVKGIYLTGWSVGTKEKFNKLIQLVNNTELNSMVIDVKEDLGRITYNSQVQWVKDSGSIVNMVGDINQVLETLKKNNIYPIARIVCFKDSNLAEAHPELAIKTKSGNIWRDNHQVAWLNPYNKETWEYLVELSKEAVKLGFKDVQYDYVRFPTDGNVSDIDYGESADEKSKAEAISEFLAYAKKELEPFGADVSADIFGIVPIVPGDAEGIGQHLELVAKDIDYICPMAYPSHYANIKQNGVGQKINGVLYQYPDLDPYGVIYNTLLSGKERLEVSGAKADVRPWLQAFTADYLHSGTWQRYGGEQIKQQIQATKDAGYSQYLLWDPNNNYKGFGQ